MCAKDDVSPDVFHKPALLVRKFVEDYHEKLEEKFIFPPFEKQRKLVELVAVRKPNWLQALATRRLRHRARIIQTRTSSPAGAKRRVTRRSIVRRPQRRS